MKKYCVDCKYVCGHKAKGIQQCGHREHSLICKPFCSLFNNTHDCEFWEPKPLTFIQRFFGGS